MTALIEHTRGRIEQVNEVTPAALPTLRGPASIGGADVSTLALDDLLDELASHVSICEIGARCCADCRLARDVTTQSAISIARSEYETVLPWIRRWRDICIYCAEVAEHRDHLVPEPWTGPIARAFVPTVPACADCNVRIGDTNVHTIGGRAEIVASSLRKKHAKSLLIPDRDDDWFLEFSFRMAENLKASQAQRRALRRRLIILDAGGAPCVESVMVW